MSIVCLLFGTNLRNWATSDGVCLKVGQAECKKAHIELQWFLRLKIQISKLILWSWTNLGPFLVVCDLPCKMTGCEGKHNVSDSINVWP